MIALRSKRFILESQFDDDDVITSDRLPSSIVSCNRALKLRHAQFVRAHFPVSVNF